MRSFVVVHTLDPVAPAVVAVGLGDPARVFAVFVIGHAVACPFLSYAVSDWCLLTIDPHWPALQGGCSRCGLSASGSRIGSAAGTLLGSLTVGFVQRAQMDSSTVGALTGPVMGSRLPAGRTSSAAGPRFQGVCAREAPCRIVGKWLRPVGHLNADHLAQAVVVVVFGGERTNDGLAGARWRRLAN